MIRTTYLQPIVWGFFLVIGSYVLMISTTIYRGTGVVQLIIQQRNNKVVRNVPPTFVINEHALFNSIVPAKRNADFASYKPTLTGNSLSDNPVETSRHWWERDEIRRAAELFSTTGGESFALYQLNVNSSNAMALNRDVVNTRHDDCFTRYHNHTNLPTVSVVIPMHNELWSMLLRLIHSLINRSDLSILREIIIVDDASSHEELKQPLDDYVRLLPVKTSVMRNRRREGLMRSRIIGARHAQGEVIAFLDAHTEVNHDWLLPLLVELVQDPMMLAVPHLDIINYDTIEYEPWNLRVTGSWDWNLDYVWKWTETESTADVDLIPATAVSGSVMVTWKNTFFKLGAFDDGMDIWGGENVEIAFRYWMCGGSVMTVPCSRVGHAFRPRIPFTFPMGYGVMEKNLIRIAEVWMGNYKELFYAIRKPNVTWNKRDINSLMKRIRLKKTLKCKNFDWFLTIANDAMIPNIRKDVFYGQIKHLKSHQCLEVDSGSGYLIFTDCVRRSRQQIFSLTREGQLRFYNFSLCIDSSFNKVLVSEKKCVNDKWTFDIGQEVGSAARFLIELHDIQRPVGFLKFGSLCMVPVNMPGFILVEVEFCNEENSESYYWIFSHKLDKNFSSSTVGFHNVVARYT